MSGKPTILIVDDEPDVVTMFQRNLEPEGYDTIPAYDGIAAVDIAESDQPDLILLDIMMPMMSGYDVCRQVRSNPNTKHIPIVCMTSASSPETRQRARDAGAQAVLIKPFAVAELIAQIKRYLPKASADTDDSQ